jgi:hypothetical protein
MANQRPDAEAAAAKWCLAELIASGVMLSDALHQLKISWRELNTWRKSDPDFAQELRDAQQHLATVKADELCRLHQTGIDAKMANVLANVWKWRIEKLAPAEFGPKIEPPKENMALLDVLSEAIKRIDIPEYKPQQVIELKPVEARCTDDPQDRHQP